MVKRSAFISLLSFLCFISPIHAAVREVVPGADASVQIPLERDASFRSRDIPVEVLLGPSILGGAVGVGLAVRAGLPHHFKLELGGVVPHHASTLADDQTLSGNGNVATSGEVKRVGEAHIGLLYPIYEEKRWSIEGGAGLSLGFITSRIRQTVTIPATTEELDRHDTRPSPWVHVSANSQFTDHLSFRLRTTWVTYGGKVTQNGESVNLAFSGVLIEPMLQWRF